MTILENDSIEFVLLSKNEYFGTVLNAICLHALNKNEMASF